MHFPKPWRIPPRVNVWLLFSSAVAWGHSNLKASVSAESTMPLFIKSCSASYVVLRAALVCHLFAFSSFISWSAQCPKMFSSLFGVWAHQRFLLTKITRLQKARTISWYCTDLPFSTGPRVCEAVCRVQARCV